MTGAPTFGTTWDQVAPPESGRSVWMLLVPLCALFAWFPLGAYWQSDDYFALQYSQDAGRALSDFAGPQYGTQDVWLFYRPLITLSFWFDQLLGGHPLVSHLSNTIAHALTAWLVAMVWSRFAGAWAGGVAGLCWALMPSHAGSVLWAVGRVDSHTTLWIALSLWLQCKAIEKDCRLGRWGAVGAFALALMSKESAVVTPGLIGLLTIALVEPGQRVRRAALALWPYVLVLVGYFALRFQLLGTMVGGYESREIDVLGSLGGLGNSLLDLLNPWRVGGADAYGHWVTGEGGPDWARDSLSAELPGWWETVGYVPAALAVLMLLVRRRFGYFACLLGVLMACVPLAPFLDSDKLQNLRYFYLPATCLVGLFAGAGGWVGLAWLLFAALPLVEVRSDYSAVWDDMRSMHGMILAEAAEVEPGEPMFVAGLPVINRRGNAIQFHYGVDRLAAPPFVETGPVVYPVRPALAVQGSLRLPGDPPAALPEGTTWFFEGPKILGKAPESRLPTMSVRTEGHVDFSVEGLERLRATDGATDHADAGFVVCGASTPAFRVTLFTSVGYLVTWVDARQMGPWMELRDDETWINLFGLLRDARVGLPGTKGDRPLIDCLPVPTTLDLEPTFPVMIEGGHIDVIGGVPRFEADVRAEQMLHWAFDRRFPAFLRGVQGRGP